MKNWKHKVAIRHLMTEKSDAESVKKSMNDIADVLEKNEIFNAFFESLDAGVEEFRLCENLQEANSLLTQFWDYCDDNNIWVEF